MIRVVVFNSRWKENAIYQFGHKILKALQTNSNFNVDEQIVTSFEEIISWQTDHKYDLCVYSYNPSTWPWMRSPKELQGKHIAIWHEPEQVVLDGAWRYGTPDWFDAWIACDPTLVTENRPINNVFSTVRPVARFIEPISNPDIFTVGCNSRGFDFKGHLDLTNAIQKEFDECILRFNMSSTEWGDPSGAEAKRIENQCRSAIRKPKIELEFSDYFFDDELGMIRWMSKNSCNAFLYKQLSVPDSMAGVVSSPDLAVSAQKPIIVSSCSLVRHIIPYTDYYPNKSIKDLYIHQTENNSVSKMYEEWTEEKVGEFYQTVLERL